MRYTTPLGLALLVASSGIAAPPTGLQPSVQISAPTRLDWKFVASAFGPDAARLAADYDSRQQHYQLFVPRHYDASQPWPLVVFISPGDEPLGWRVWQQPCEKLGALFCAAYGAGNNCPAGQRVRIVLDMLDDVRRHYRVDPDQTYLTGFSGGGRMACTIAFALPEYFGGVAPICGTNPLPRLDALRHRIHDRLSVAFVTGADDFNRRENELYMAPLFAELGIRSKLWVVPNLGHALPSADRLTEVCSWLTDGLKQRREVARAHPGLAVPADEALTPEKVAARHVEAAEGDLRTQGRAWRGVALLREVLERWPATEAGDRARQLLEDVTRDAAKARAIAEEGSREEREFLSAQAKALERFGDRQRACRAWDVLAHAQPSTPAGERAAAEAKRLRAALAATPYLGVGLAPDGLLVTEVQPRGPADRAGIKAGDRLVRLAGTPIKTQEQMRQALARHKPGETIEIQIERGGQVTGISAELGSLSAEQ